jgi:hypothetical protein
VNRTLGELVIGELKLIHFIPVKGKKAASRNPSYARPVADSSSSNLVVLNGELSGQQQNRRR